MEEKPTEENDALHKIKRQISILIYPLVVNYESTFFVLDESVAYNNGIAEVKKEDLYDGASFSPVFLHILSGKPSWIHANMIFGFINVNIITIAYSRTLAVEQTSINVSSERSFMAKIVA